MPPTCPARESERALAFVNCLRLNGIVFDQIHMLTGRDLCNSLHTIFTFLSLLEVRTRLQTCEGLITVGMTRTSVVPSGPAVTPLTTSAEPPCPSSVWRGR